MDELSKVVKIVAKALLLLNNVDNNNDDNFSQ